MAAKRRSFLGRRYDLFDRQRVYAMADGLEIDNLEGYEVTRRRVYFDDVLLVTYHRYLGWVFLLVTGLAAGFFGLIGLGLAVSEPEAGAIVGLLCGFPFALPFVLRLIFRVDVVTVYGRRTKAEMNFSFRKGRARAIFGWVCEQTRLAQEGAAGERGGTPAGEAPPEPPSPPA